MGVLIDNPFWKELSEKMLKTISSTIYQEPYYLSNWGILLSYFTSPLYEIAICGNKSFEFRKGIDNSYIPNKIICGSNDNSELPLLKNRLPQNDTFIFICHNYACNLPVKSVAEALIQMKSK
ncbi:MAG: hypothetical protein SFY32_06635 [Bacteroidota bacterium]|nr:hypothetical protein [Bacteroidota bacterium]